MNAVAQALSVRLSLYYFIKYDLLFYIRYYLLFSIYYVFSLLIAATTTMT